MNGLSWYPESRALYLTQWERKQLPLQTFYVGFSETLGLVNVVAAGNFTAMEDAYSVVGYRARTVGEAAQKFAESERVHIRPDKGMNDYETNGVTWFTFVEKNCMYYYKEL